MELKDDTDVSLWPSQPSVAESRPRRTGPVMWRNWWEAYVDQSLWAGSCPFNVADSQLWLMQRCEQRTDGRNILSHKNVCMKRSNGINMLLDVWLTRSVLPCVPVTIFHDRAFIKKLKFTGEKVKFLQKVWRVNDFFDFSSLISLLAVCYLPLLLHSSN